MTGRSGRNAFDLLAQAVQAQRRDRWRVWTMSWSHQSRCTHQGQRLGLVLDQRFTDRSRESQRSKVDRSALHHGSDNFRMP
jgi:hypothetical protein